MELFSDHLPIVSDSFSDSNAPAIMEKYLTCAKAEQTGKTSFFIRENRREVQQAIQRNGRLLGIMGYNMKSAAASSPGTDCAILLFDSDGVLLNIYGNPYMIETLRKDGISLYTTWGLEDIGPNAVTVGLHERIQIYTVGKQNCYAGLNKYGIYFSPVHFDTPAQGRVKIIQEIGFFGGLALISLEAQYNPTHAFLLSTIKHDLLMSLLYKQTSFNHYEKLGSGVLSVNFTCGSNSTGVISYINSALFQLIGLPENDVLEISSSVDPQNDLIYQRVEDIFDPPPKNRLFWSAIKKRETLNGNIMSLSLRSRERKCIIFSEPVYQSDLDMNGLVFYISALQENAAIAPRQAKSSANSAFDNIIGQSQRLTEVIERSRRVARTESNVMLFGESGTGKEVFARAIHDASKRSGKPFIAVNCGAIPRDLVASELFGYVGGAFTGANKQGGVGKFELANGGTLFLDEIGECPLDVQAALLRVVEQKQFMRVGGSKMITADVRIISATNAPLWEMILQKRFREDLFYRLATMQITLPPLRERRDDIVPLASYFIQRYSRKLEKEQTPTLSPDAERTLMEYDWPGNVRELRNSIECIVSLYEDSVIESWHIIENVGLHAPGMRSSPPHQAPHSSAASAPLTRELILDALKACDGNRSDAAKYLGIARKTLYRNMERLGISKEFE